MSTEAQINANRRNSQKSTGPRTAEGKAAVSQNAVKHGLFSSEALVEGENQADFDLFREEMLAELAPIGALESMLAERFVNLSWRLKRAERMQNQAIDVMIAQDGPSPLAQRLKESLPKYLQDVYGDPRGGGEELILGRAAIHDCANYRTLERLSMYERRIESSMLRTLNELESRQVMREVDRANASEERSVHAIPKASGFEAATRPTEKKGDLKKQSQFVPAQTGAKTCVLRDYENTPHPGPRASKAKQSQFQTPVLPKGVGKRGLQEVLAGLGRRKA
ncbi:MAG: hypothetical protein ACYSYV_02160 [Planctomycetota bacterium]|jgi:hypothetical protein